MEKRAAPNVDEEQRKEDERDGERPGPGRVSNRENRGRMVVIMIGSGRESRRPSRREGRRR